MTQKEYYGVLISTDGESLTQIQGVRSIDGQTERSEFKAVTGSPVVCGIYELRLGGTVVGVVNVEQFDLETGHGLWVLEGEWV